MKKYFFYDISFDLINLNNKYLKYFSEMNKVHFLSNDIDNSSNFII